MSEQDFDYLGFFKYEGQLVAEGYLDARKSAEALIGIDGVIRYFLYQLDKSLAEKEFEIPVRVRRGSWEALIPHSIGDWIITAAGAGITTYATSAMKKIADNDFKDVKTKDILKQVFKTIKWVLQISKHLKSLVIKQFNNVQFKEENGENLIGIPNDKEEWLFVPKKYLEAYQNCPEKLFAKLAEIIEPERELEIGINEKEPLDVDDFSRSVKIHRNEKHIFYKTEDITEVLFPELIHNSYVELEGHVSRGNENANSIGFEYLRHILTCYPTSGNIKDYKSLMFTNCIIKGYVDRRDEDGNINEKKPKIRFLTLDEMHNQTPQMDLFNLNT